MATQAQRDRQAIIEYLASGRMQGLTTAFFIHVDTGIDRRFQNWDRGLKYTRRLLENMVAENILVIDMISDGETCSKIYKISDLELSFRKYFKRS